VDDDLYEHGGKHVSEDKTRHISTTSTRDGHLVRLSVRRDFRLKESLRRIRDRIIDQYGSPDEVQLGTALLMEYKLTNGPDKELARFSVRVRILRGNHDLCLLPGHLRDGSTIARMTMTLDDNELRRENTKATLADIKNWRLDAIQRMEANNTLPLPRDAASGC
jgi:hypothetical protein